MLLFLSDWAPSLMINLVLNLHCVKISCSPHPDMCQVQNPDLQIFLILERQTRMQWYLQKGELVRKTQTDNMSPRLEKKMTPACWSSWHGAESKQDTGNSPTASAEGKKSFHQGWRRWSSLLRLSRKDRRRFFFHDLPPCLPVCLRSHPLIK